MASNCEILALWDEHPVLFLAFVTPSCLSCIYFFICISLTVMKAFLVYSLMAMVKRCGQAGYNVKNKAHESFEYELPTRRTPRAKRYCL